MYKIIIALLLMPCLLCGQAKKKPVKKKKPAVFQSKFRPPALPPVQEETTTAPAADAVVSIPPAATVFEKPVSLKQAGQLAQQYQTGLILFVPYATESNGRHRYNTVFADTTAAAQHLDDLRERGQTGYGASYLVYMPTPTELKTIQQDGVGLYPAWIFYTAGAVLAGKRAGLQTDVYAVDELQQQLQKEYDKKLLTDLQDRFHKGLLNNDGLEALMMVTKQHNKGNYTQRAAPEEDWLLDSLVQQLTAANAPDTQVFRLIEKVCAEPDRISELRQPHVFRYLVEYYQQINDTDFKWYDAINYRFVTAYAEPLPGQDAVKLEDPWSGQNGVPAQAAVAAPIPLDTMLRLHEVFIRQLRNVQLMNESIKLLQKQYDLLQQQQRSMATAAAHMMPFMRWFFDSLLQCNRGATAAEQVLKNMGDKMSGEELAAIQLQYAGFKEYKLSLVKDLALLLNNFSWLFFKDGHYDDWLPQLAAWSRTSLEMEPLNPYYLDTYAHLLYIQGDKKAAADYQAKAITVLKTNKAYADVKWMIPQMQVILTTMKNGGTIGREDYIEK